jgi:hypothetical protein
MAGKSEVAISICSIHMTLLNHVLNKVLCHYFDDIGLKRWFFVIISLF